MSSSAPVNNIQPSTTGDAVGHGEGVIAEIGHDRFLARADLQILIRLLQDDGFTVVGPKLDQGAIVYGQITQVTDLPVGWTDQQQPGQYRLVPRNDNRMFGYVVGPHSWKQFLFPPSAIVATAQRAGGSWQMSTPDEPPPRYAFLGVRACELAAIAVQDKVFLGGAYVDPIYQQRRASVLLIAVNCTQAASTCFCTSMKTGPRCKAGFDLALTEIESGFTLETGSERGQALALRLPLREALAAELGDAQKGRAEAERQITKQMNTDGLHELLMGQLRSPHWDTVAQRCLSCTNCTMVCPTCFCSTVTEVSDLTGDRVDRERHWDSCFNVDISRVNGVPARDSVASRYRQWLTHKLATWQDQFGTSGCVGCGRCITWCPPGIDLTEEVRTLQQLALKSEHGNSPDAAHRQTMEIDSEEAGV
jgi:sulfhydrogenase subunit beta (sulfur reductase)